MTRPCETAKMNKSHNNPLSPLSDPLNGDLKLLTSKGNP
jgi:hypothetical protein